jgi:RHS repeat-associated protein
MALDRILAYGNTAYRPDSKIVAAESSRNGTSLAQVQVLSDAVGLHFQMAYRPAGAILVVPAVVHWKAGHFAALVAGSGERYLVQDPTFGGELWVSRKALDEEASGYVLVPQGPLPARWRPVSAEESATVWGKGYTYDNNNQYQTSTEVTQGGSAGGPPGTCEPMAQYRIHSMIVALNITDEPVGYSPPVGGAVAFQVSYHQREVFQPQVPAYGNLGPKWTYDWLAFVEDNPDPTHLNDPVNAYLRLGGQETYAVNPATGLYAPHARSRAVVVRTSQTPITYERRLPDGSIELYAQSDNAPAVPRKVYLTSWADPQGNTVSLTYDGLKVTGVTDAIGQVTTISYDLPGDPLKITKVTDPYGRFATFEYNGQGQLQKITDVIGIASSFTYGTGDFITELITPYGTTHFATGIGPPAQLRWIEATDPLGAIERVEFRHVAPGTTDSESPAPVGITIHNGNLALRNTFFWSKRASALDPRHRDYKKAVLIHWLHDAGLGPASGIKESEKRPLERRVWYSYPQQGAPYMAGGFTAAPAMVARVLDDGTTQLYQYEYNTKGKVLKETDPVGRETRYTYGTGSTPDPDQANGTGVDLLKTEVKNGANYELISSATYNAQHQPLTSTDAAGQTTTSTYLSDGSGLLETVVTPARNGHDGNPLTVAERTTTYEYYPANDPAAPRRLKKITRPSVGGASGPSITLVYDGYGRARTTTDSDGYALITDYDALDRPTRITYPDGTYEETTYNRLDAEGHRDRLGRWNHLFHDALRRVRASRDASGRTVTREWCTCGSLDRLLDAAGNATKWDWDLQGRVTKETRSDGKFSEQTYEATTSRLKTVKDPKNQMRTFTYDLDGRVTGIGYTGAVIPTTNVTYSYRDLQGLPDPYGRLLRMSDATGTTAFTYHPAGVLGATRLKSVDGPLTADLLEYTYDEMGLPKNRKLNGSANETTNAFDSLGRLRTRTTSLGDFTFTYEGVNSRTLSLVYPNGQRVDYAYFGNVNDHRLQEIHNKLAGGGTLSKFGYTYDVGGDIQTWSQQRGTNPTETFTFGYDRADQLTKASLSSSSGAILKSYGYGYDSAGNRTVAAADASVTATTHNNRNKITGQVVGGALPVAGLLNEPGTVAINAAPVPVSSDNRFAGTAPVSGGTQTFTVSATDANGNTRSNTYQVPVTGAAGGPFGYDDNGNLNVQGSRTYDWDAENRLVAVKDNGTTLVSYVYDGRGRRFQKIAGGVTRTFLYDGAQLAEERLSSGGTIKYFDGPGIDQHLARQDQAGVVSYYASDHLGSVGDVTDSAGGVVVTRRYDPWGTLLAGSATAGYAYTGRDWEPETGLYYYRARYYEPTLGRFLSEDPIGLSGGTNFYSYVYGDPTNLIDPLGLFGSSGPQPNPQPAPAPPRPPGSPSPHTPTCNNCPAQVPAGFNQVCWNAALSAPPEVRSCMQSLCNPGPGALPSITCQARGTPGCPPGTMGFSGPGSGITLCQAATSNSQCFTNNVMYHEMLHKCVPNSGGITRAHGFVYTAAWNLFPCAQ